MMWRYHARPFHGLGYAVTLLGMALAIGVIEGAQRGLGILVPNAGVFFMLVATASAYWFGTGPAALAVALSLVEVFNLYMGSVDDLNTFASRFLVILVALVAGVVLARVARRAALESRRRAAELDAVFRAMGDGVIVYSRDGVPVRANPAAVASCGFDPTGLSRVELNRRLNNRYLDDSKPRLEDLPVSRALRGETVAPELFVFNHPDGTDHVRRASAAALEMNGQPDGAVMVWSDVTDLKRAEEERERQAAELEATLAAAPDGLLIYDASGRIVRMNGAAERILGFSADRYMRIQDVGERNKLARSLRPDGTPFLKEETPAWRALHGEVVSNVTVILHGENGEPTWTSMSAAPIVADGGRRIGAIATFVDLTEMHQAALERERFLEELRNNEEQLRLATLAAGIGTWSWTPGTSEVAVSSDWRRLFGIASDVEVTFQTWRDALHPGDRERAVRELNEASEGHHEFNTEYRVVRPDGEVRWLVDLGHAYYDEGGRAIRMAGVNVDITERKLAEEERERLLRLRDEFLSVAAHELKTPVTSLKGYCQILLRRLGEGRSPSQEDQLRMLTVVDRQARKLTHLVEQLLEISRLQNGKLVLCAEDAEISPIVESAVASIRLVRPGRLILYEDGTLGKDGTSARAEVDPVRLEQVIANLVDNAAKFSPEDSPIEVATGLCLCGQLVISVRDYGEGVPESDRERIFQRFEQGDGAGHRGGLGLGLYVSRQIVEMHGGTLVCEAADGGGARFVVRLPVGMKPTPGGGGRKTVAL